MGAVFRMLNSRGVSTRRIAASADITQGRLYDYMNGKSRVEKLSLFEQIADAFRIPGHLLGLARRSWEPAPADPDHQRADRPSPDGDDLAAMATTPATTTAPTATSPARFPWPAPPGDLLLAANVAASSSHLALHAGAAAWARTGLDLATRGPRVPALTARLNTMQARALAVAAQRIPAAYALDAARRDLDGAADTDHPWLSPFDAAALASESALILRDLDQLDDALTHAEQAVALRESGRERSLALSRIALVDIHVRRCDVDTAVSVGHDLLSTSPPLGSVRVVQQLDELRRLLEPHRAYGPVREYLVRFDDARRARMLLLADLVPPSPGGTPGAT
ncbi:MULTISPECIES: XRE family transcriptional regulator [unclassified Streptomyces]|uniref:XRE family transcriptional regulator n=1 Tax=unclassified Streptomyces TaxID=2593676 RepID=UPI001EF003EE|nr:MULTISPECIES: XRE family transcriptional regulator [unclassified Streptomyces]